VVGSCASVLDGGPPASGYALHLVDVVQRSLVHDTGTVEPRFGEGLYLGSAESTGQPSPAASPMSPTGTERWATRSGTPRRRTSKGRKPPVAG
jgi:hypothetical protein